MFICKVGETKILFDNKSILFKKNKLQLTIKLNILLGSEI